MRGGRTAGDAEAQRIELERQLEKQRALFANIDSRPAIPFNRGEDWDEHGKLRPGAPVYSPFVRHVSVDAR